MPEDSPPLAQEFAAALRALAAQVQGLRDDLGRVYGRDAAGRLNAQAPQEGGVAPVPAPKWTPRDVENVIDRLFGETPKRGRRR